MIIFKNFETEQEFLNLYNKLSNEDKSEFGKIVKKKADEKIIKMENDGDFYINKKEIRAIYKTITTKKNETHA